MNPESYLLILGERQAIAWVLSTQRMAFPRTSRVEVDRLAIGDELFVYTTRGAFGNPTRDRGRVVGRATVASVVRELDEPITFAEREFPRGCRIELQSLAPFRNGVELQPLVEQMKAFPRSRAWSIYLRRPLLHLGAGDATLLRERLESFAGMPNKHIQGYLDRAR